MKFSTTENFIRYTLILLVKNDLTNEAKSDTLTYELCRSAGSTD